MEHTGSKQGVDVLSARSQEDVAGHRIRPWHPRVWLGSSPTGWTRLLWRNRLDVDWRNLPGAAFYSAWTPMNGLLRGIQGLAYGRAVRATQITRDPVFVIGHFRAGTTLLHELLSLDDELTFPTAYECYLPNHFLLTEWFAVRWLKWMIPPLRPQDTMEMKWELPAEDEFALFNLGLPSPYLNIGFPNRPPQDLHYRDLRGLSAAELERWERVFVRFLKEITLRRPQRIVLKSPFHTCRLPVLTRLFPRARFVHVARNPYRLFTSTLHMWNAIYEVHGLQQPDGSFQKEYVFDSLELMHERFEEDRKLLSEDQLFETRYEELVADPVATLEALYEKLGLGDTGRLTERWLRLLASRRGYQPNRYRPMDESLRAEIARRWKPYFERHGYDLDEPGAAAPAALAEPARGER